MDVERLRARDVGIAPGTFCPGGFNAITDVAGVRVGHVTVIEGADVRTGATAILPHGGNLYRDRVPAGMDTFNGYGKLIGTTQVLELGEIETPIVLTNTLCVPRAADAILDWVLDQPECSGVRSVNPVVGETNDGMLNAIHRRVLRPAVIRQSIEIAASGPVAEGCVGGGTGTVALGFKAGIGTASRVLPATFGGHTVGVLVQANFSGVLRILDVSVGARLGEALPPVRQPETEHGSIMIVVATDAPLGDRNLKRLARRSFAGLACTGSRFSDGSGDYAIAFSTHPAVRRSRTTEDRRSIVDLTNEAMSPLFQATIEATEEAVYNSLFVAESMTGNGRTIESLPIDRVLGLLGKHQASTHRRSA